MKLQLLAVAILTFVSGCDEALMTPVASGADEAAAIEAEIVDEVGHDQDREQDQTHGQ